MWKWSKQQKSLSPQSRPCFWNLSVLSEADKTKLFARIKSIPPACCPPTLGQRQWRKGPRGRGANGQQGIYSLSLILMAPLPWIQHTPNAAQSRHSSSMLPQAPPLCFYCLFFWPFADECMLIVAVGVWVCECVWAFLFFGFAQPKPRQTCWLRGLCIPLRWWRDLSSVSPSGQVLTEALPWLASQTRGSTPHERVRRQLARPG